jgi:uncharacterized protein
MRPDDIPQVDQDFAAAIYERNFERAAQLLQTGAQINRLIQREQTFDRDVVVETSTYLIDASADGDVETMRFLLERGADPNIASVYCNSTALLQAALCREHAAVDLLLAHGADVHALDRCSHQNAFEYATEKVDPIVLERLLAAGARGSLRHIGFSIDGGAAAREVVRLLVEHGIDINAIDDWGRTPLMWAAEYAEVETVRFMIELGADVHRVSAANMNGVENRHTALSLARGEKRADVVALLRQHGARDSASAGRSVGSLLSRLWNALID